MILRRGPLTAQIAADLGPAVLAGRHSRRDHQRAQAQHRGRQRRALHQHPVHRRARASGSSMLIVLGLLFWFGYRAPMAGVSLLRRSVDQPADRHRPGHRARAGPGRLHRPHGPLEPARGDPRGLRADGAGQGPEQQLGDRAACAAQCAAAGDHPVGRAARPGAGGVRFRSSGPSPRPASVTRCSPR